MATKLHIDPELAKKIGNLYAMDYKTGQIANFLKISEHTVIDVLQIDDVQRRRERSMYYR